MKMEIADSDTGFIYKPMALMDGDTVRELLQIANYCKEHMSGNDEHHDMVCRISEVSYQCELVLPHVE